MKNLFQKKKKGVFLTEGEKIKVEAIIHLRAVRFGSLHPNGFSYEDIKKKYSKRLQDWQVVKAFLNDAWDNYHNNRYRPTPFQYFDKAEGGNGGPEHSIYILNYEASFNFLDYVELIETRENSKSAHRYAFGAIVLNILTLCMATDWQGVWNFFKLLLDHL